MHDPEFVHEVIAALEQLGVPYFVAGSISSSTWGEIRATNDADIVIDPNETQVIALVQEFEKEHYAPLEAAMDALRRRSMFNIISNKSMMKIDLVIAKKTPFALEQFKRRTQANVCGGMMYLQTPEDTILSKLSWGKQSESEKQLRDVVGVLAVMGNTLDQGYLNEWAGELGLSEELEKARRIADESIRGDATE